MGYWTVENGMKVFKVSVPPTSGLPMLEFVKVSGLQPDPIDDEAEERMHKTWMDGVNAMLEYEDSVIDPDYDPENDPQPVRD